MMAGMTRWVLHVDMDQFLVAVELLRRPELTGLPVIVGGRGDPTERAVVSTASYEARDVGVRAGLPLRIAQRKCPDAVFLPVDFPVYQDASARVMRTLKAWPDAIVEVLGWDEAFVGVQTDDPISVAHGLQAAVLESTGLHCSVGIGDTLLRAKTATDFGKPQGVFELTRANWLAVLGERPTTALWGVGKKIAGRLSDVGIETVAQLAHTADEPLVAAFGPSNGPHLGRVGRGDGRAWPDDTPWVPRAHGRETTYQEDLADEAAISAAVAELSERVIADLHQEGRAAQRVFLKIRFAPFFTFTRTRKLPEPTFDVDVIAGTAMDLFRALEDHRPVRLLGVRAEMVPPEGGY